MAKKYTPTKNVAIFGKKLEDMTQKELKELYESGDTRFIAVADTKRSSKEGNED